MRVADYIFKTLADKGVRHAFLVVGGGAMQLNDAIRLEKRITPVCCHHEQSCSIAAEGYFRASGRLPIVSVTTGPGGTNALTGVMGAWLDSIPMLIISGQVKFETTIASCPEIGLRQLGDQEINIVDIVRPVTKYAKMVTDPKAIGEELHKALREATSGRPGPVWLDVPLNVQGAVLPDDYAFDASAIAVPAIPKPTTAQIEELKSLLDKSHRPVIIAGHGIRLAEADRDFIAFMERTGIPTVTTFNGFDIVPSNHPLYFGRIGTIGQRRANFVLQNADLVLSLGSRNNIRQISYNWENFAKRAKKVIIDIDPHELAKPTVRPDLAIRSDVGEFLKTADGLGDSAKYADWTAWCERIRDKYPPHTPDQLTCENGVNPYHMTAVLSECCPADAAVGIGNGTVSIAAFQTWKTKPGQRVFCNSGCASMGYDLPASLGAAVASEKTTVCLAGDGSLMMNLQELVTVVYRKLPLKVFLFDNGGYTSIRQTQGNLFSPQFIGCDAGSGVGFPDFAKLAAALGFPVRTITNHDDIRPCLEEVFKTTNPEFIIVRIPSSLGFSPKLSARRLPDGKMVSPTLEDMFPFLDRKEMEENICRI